VPLSIQVTDTPTRTSNSSADVVSPFSATTSPSPRKEDTIGAVWTEQRDAALGTESTGSDQDNADVAGDPETVGGTCTSSLTDCFDTTPGLNQNIYAASITP